MKVLHISHFDRHGGACIAAYRQHQALLAAGVDSAMWVRHKVTNDPQVFEYRPPSDLGGRVRRIARRQWLGLQKTRAQLTGEMFDDRSEHGGGELLELPPHDVINVQFSQGFVDLPALLHKIPATTPIVFTLHEMSMFTGGCSYSYDCRGFEDQCGNCPQLGVGHAHDFSRQSWLRKEQAYSQRNPANLHFAADSHWIAAEAKASGLLKEYPASVIHYGIDTEVFCPLDRGASRRAFGIPDHLPVVAFCAASVTDERKGMKQLIEALNALPEKPFLLTWGRSLPPALDSIPHLHLGHMDSEHLMAITYNAADLFVMPSLEEAFGQTALEALACAVPVAAFEAGGIPDMVRHEETGLLVPTGDSVSLAAAIQRLIQNPSLARELGEAGRQMVLAEFTFSRNASRYLRLYRSLLDKDKRFP